MTPLGADTYHPPDQKSANSSRVFSAILVDFRQKVVKTTNVLPWFQSEMCRKSGFFSTFLPFYLAERRGFQ